MFEHMEALGTSNSPGLVEAGHSPGLPPVLTGGHPCRGEGKGAKGCGPAPANPSQEQDRKLRTSSIWRNKKQLKTPTDKTR